MDYISFEDLKCPNPSSLSQSNICRGFQSTAWSLQLQALTNLRRANKHYSCIFLHELLPKTINSIVAQVDNLRSHNSKESLTLVGQILQNQDLSQAAPGITRVLIGAVFSKCTSEKQFLRRQALHAIEFIHKQRSSEILIQIGQQTQSSNVIVAELAIKIIHQYLLQHNFQVISTELLQTISKNLNSKRAYIQRKTKQILEGFRKHFGEQELQKIIDQCESLDTEDSNTLTKANTQQINSKKGPSLRQYIRMKKIEQINQNKQ